jgi:hypothetical protein
MKEAPRILRTTVLRNSGSPVFSSSHRGMLRCFCAIGIYSSTVLVGSGDFPSQETRPTRQEQSPEIVHFELDQEGSRYGKDRERESFARYKAGDGVTVERRIETYPSLSAAQNKMTSMVGAADKVIGRMPHRNPQAKVTGEKFTLAYTGTKPKEPRYVILWKDGRDLYILESISLRHVLAFESQMGARRVAGP